ncbi:MAG TPA: ABC transporter ATP-binding protein [Solirubrobacterales bacterium]|nr:ABC transporter ATP-binding protein [Solirubrobacterales bacterium]
MDAGGANAIEVRGLVKRYGRFQALHGIDLDVHAGEAFGFIGPNGAGKTTVIRILLDLLRPSEGEVRVFGLDSRADTRRIHARLGYVPGDLTLWEKMTGRDVLEFLANMRGGAGAERIEPLAERLNLTLDRRIKELSRGNREKVGLIQAFMHEPDLLVLDEPTSGLDPLVQHEVFAMVDAATERGATVFFSSHYLNEVERIADRVGLIREGRMLTVDTVAGLKRRAKRRVDVTFTEPVDPAPLEALRGAGDVRAAPNRVELTFTGEMAELIAALAEMPVEVLTTPEPDLEEVFLGLYGGGGDAA